MLSSLVDFCRKDFLVRRCPAQVYLGVEHLAENEDAMRVVFVPTKDRFRPPQQIISSPGFPIASGVNPRPIFIRDVGFDVHCWAAAPQLADQSLQVQADYLFLDGLINQVCLSITTLLQGAWRQSGGDTLQDTAWAKKGQGYVLHATAEMPVVDTDFRGAIDCTAQTWDEILLSFSVAVEMLDPSADPAVTETTNILIPQPGT
jgi:hypothetical protein